MTESIKVATIITPYFIKKPDRIHFGNILDGLVHLGVVLRSNGNGGKDCIVNSPSIPEKNKLFYLATNPFYSLDSSAVVEDHTKADELLNKIFKGKYNSYSDEQKDRLRYTLYSLAGSGLQRNSDTVFILRTTNYTKHPVNHELYKGAILIAHELGIHVVNINTRVKEIKNVSGTESKANTENRNRCSVWSSDPEHPSNSSTNASKPTN